LKARIASPFIRCVALCVALLPAAILRAAPAIPKLHDWVTDNAHVLSPDQQKRLSDLLEDKEQQTSNQIVILTIDSLDGDTIEDYAQQVFRVSQIGQKHRDNGVLFVAAIKDRKMRIEVGFGLEGALTDALSSQIIRNQIAPRFKDGDYFDGLWAGVIAIDKAIQGEYHGSNLQPQARSAVHIEPGFVLFWMLFFILVLVSHVRFHRYRNHWIGPYWISGSGGGFSGGGYSSGGFSGGGFSGGGGGFSGGGGGSGGGGASGSW
jgi:uncharacterized protein